MRGRLSLASQGEPRVLLRSVEASDMEDLRAWKNANRGSFFFKGVIGPEDQRRWFEGYLERPGDCMFLVESRGLRAGCMGFRLVDEGADCYNIMASPQGAGKGILQTAMRIMCSFIRAECAAKISCKVLKSNPAVGWYKKCGYRIAEDRGDHYLMALDDENFSPSLYDKTADA